MIIFLQLRRDALIIDLHEPIRLDCINCRGRYYVLLKMLTDPVGIFGKLQVVVLRLHFSIKELLKLAKMLLLRLTILVLVLYLPGYIIAANNNLLKVLRRDISHLGELVDQPDQLDRVSHERIFVHFLPVFIVSGIINCPDVNSL